MDNPFDTILNELAEIKAVMMSANESRPQIELIDREELMRRLALSEPTIIRWEKRGKIPAIRIGASVRYNWHSVVKTLEEKK